ncbi:unnamed protein product [Didymodactylos carnosus]|uniref:Uncharacterized protein n=1 Tax=Didymodactylos carnosus TaxID=1234261 RepID=A0A814JHW8_9BILA|nr:unnamed protein product [Didymodactylos carnosus]CAF1035758.1 unnamed protein product [Didymodactylos carnosus]CAF3659667.1 unnamed protein product [Didymodactylos carnosus]CAF3806360.1 unnamed protein product [Didymodactylos carnosus]
MPDTYGLIIVGNSGVVTHRTESITCILGDRHFRIYNIPGLIEGDEERIVLNRREINRAFEEEKDNSLVVIYVFGHQNGRIRNEDIVTFRAIHNAYTFCSDSLITIVNGLPPDRPKIYNEDTQATLIDLLGMKPGQICFIDRLSSDDTHHVEVRKYLIDTILNVRPRAHTKTSNISLMTDDALQLKADLDVIRHQVDNERHEHEDVIESMKREYEATQRLSVLRRLFCQAKVDLRRLVTFHEQEEHLISVIARWEAEEIGYEDDPTSNHYIQAVRNKQGAEEKLTKHFATQHYTEVALNVCRKDIEQICFELKQIYDGRFDYEYEPLREYYILFDDLRFDPSISDAKHDFVNDLYAFTCLHFRDIE